MQTDSAMRRLVWSLLIVAFLLRLGLGLALGLNDPPKTGSDAEEYDTYAWNVVKGHGYRGMSPDVSNQDHLTAYRPPGTSLTWAMIYRVVGHRFDAIRLFGCILGAASVYEVFRLGRRLFTTNVGLISAAGYTIFPHAIFYSVDLGSEVGATYLFLLYLNLLLDFADRPNWTSATLAGLALGLAMLYRPAFMFMIPLTILWGAWQFRKVPHSIVQASFTVVVAVTCLIPWTVRNYVVFQAFIPFSTMGGSVLLQGNNRIVAENPEFFGYNVWDTQIPEYADALRAPNDELVRDRVAGDLAKAWMKDNLEKLPLMALAKLYRGCTPFLQPKSPWHFRWGTSLSWGPVLVLFLLSVIPTLVGMLRSENPGWIIHLGLLHYVAATLIFFGYARYRHAIEPLCLVLAAVSLQYLWIEIGSYVVNTVRVLKSNTRPLQPWSVPSRLIQANRRIGWRDKVVPATSDAQV